MMTFKHCFTVTVFSVMVMAAPMAQAAELSAVDCTEFSINLTFDATVTGGSADITRVSLSSSSSGPYTSLSADSTASQEPNGTINITFSEADRIAVGPIAGGRNCHVKVASGFSGEVTRDSIASE